jgi:hypothetical protein
MIDDTVWLDSTGWFRSRLNIERDSGERKGYFNQLPRIRRTLCNSRRRWLIVLLGWQKEELEIGALVDRE